MYIQMCKASLSIAYGSKNKDIILNIINMLCVILIFGLRLRPEARSPFSSTSTRQWDQPAPGQRCSRQSQARAWPTFQGSLLAGGRESQGNPPSTPAPVIRSSMCQSRRPRWQARDDTSSVRSPPSAAWTSQKQENIPVIMAFQCQLACWVCATTPRLTMERQHVCELCKVYWERLRFLAHKCSTALDATCLWRQTIRSHLHPWSFQKKRENKTWNIFLKYI